MSGRQKPDYKIPDNCCQECGNKDCICDEIAKEEIVPDILSNEDKVKPKESISTN